MLGVVTVLAVLASACRVNFGEVPDAVIGESGHDEDGDGIIDASDHCPHVPEAANLDTDTDGVGDVCDPDPARPDQRWLLFSPMGDLPDFSPGPTGCWNMTGDDWRYDDVANPCQLIRTGDVANVDIWIGLTVETVSTGGVQAAIIINGTSPYWYAEIFDAGDGTARLSIIEYTGSSYLARDTKPIGSTFPMGTVELHLAARVGASFTAYSGSDRVSYATPGYLGDRLTILGFGNHGGRVRYVAIVTSL